MACLDLGLDRSDAHSASTVWHTALILDILLALHLERASSNKLLYPDASRE